MKLDVSKILRWSWVLGLAVMSGCSGQSTPTPSRSPVSPETPRLEGFEQIEPGVLFREHQISRGETTMRIWTYVPAEPPPAPGSRGLILIAPAGSNLLTGMRLSEGDRTEHLPYVAAGYVLVAYDLDGAVQEGASQAEMAIAIQRFFSARLGVDNAIAALDDALAGLPEVDPQRVFTAGHSSAGTLALQVAAHEPRIRGAVAYAPVSDLRSHFGELLATLQPSDPLAEAIAAMSPMTLASKLHQVMLFHAVDDSVVPIEQTRAMQKAIAASGGEATVEAVDRGDHYEAMIREGIPRAIDWLDAQR